LQIPLKTVLTS